MPTIRAACSTRFSASAGPDVTGVEPGSLADFQARRAEGPSPLPPLRTRLRSPRTNDDHEHRVEQPGHDWVLVFNWSGLILVQKVKSIPMTLIKTLWASVQGNPVFMRRVNGWLTIFWILMIPVSVVTGWISSVAYISALSLWALVSGHWSAWQAARVEVTQQHEAAQREEHPLEEKVVEELVNRTNIKPAGEHSPDAAMTSASGKTTSNTDVEAMIRSLCEQVDQLRNELPRAQSASFRPQNVASRPISPRRGAPA